MTKRSKNYHLGRPATPLRTRPESQVAQFKDRHGDIICTYDLSSYAALGPGVAEMTLAFRGWGADKRPSSLQTALAGLRRWFTFLKQRDMRDYRSRDVDDPLVREYIAWLGRTVRALQTRTTLFSTLKALVTWLQRYRPDLAPEAIEFPCRPFPPRGMEAEPRRALSKREIESVLRAARNEISAHWARYQAGLQAAARPDGTRQSSAPLRKRDVDTLEAFLAVCAERFGGRLPKARELTRPGSSMSAFHKALRRYGGAKAVQSYLHATAETLTPYLLLLGAQLYANPMALLELKRDCMVDHVLLDGRVVVIWNKGRARREQRRSFLRRGSASVPNLIEQVRAMTQPLLAYAPQKHRHLLFLIEGHMQDGPSVVPASKVDLRNQLERFVARHNLNSDSGGPLSLSLAALRPTGLTLAHHALGGDVLKTQALANHADPATTERYIRSPSLKAAHDAALGRLQTQFVSSVREGVLTHVQTPTPRATQDSAHTSAGGFTCRDPLGGIGPGQKAGSLCTAWLGCFTCPNAVIPLATDVLARLLATQRALLEARRTLAPERWSAIYEPKLQILERDILPRFPPDMLASAVRYLPCVPATPPIE